MGSTFIDQVLAGTTQLSELDDYIDRWHNAPGLTPLHEYLGLTWEEYGAFIENPRAVVQAKLAAKVAGDPMA